MLISYGFEDATIEVTHTPSKVLRRLSKKTFDPTKINVVFASWNNSEPNELHDRGILYLIDMLAKNPEFSLTIPLRDSKTKEFWQVAKQKNVSDRISLINIESSDELEKMFDESDLVAFVAQDRVVKDVPNSLIDGLAYGKPIMISDALDFYTTVDEQGIGYVIKVGEKAKRIKITIEEYKVMSKKAYAYSAKHAPDLYQKSATNYEVRNENSHN